MSGKVEPWNVVIESGEHHWMDHDITMRWTVFSHRLEFSAKQATRQPDGSFVYYDGAHTFPAEFEAGERFVDGTVKWDGCSHVNFGDENGYLHLCGGPMFAALTFVLREAFRLASEKVPSFSDGVADAAHFVTPPTGAPGHG